MNPDNITTPDRRIIYAIPGLGTDGRIFSKLDLPYQLEILQWPEPDPGEDLLSYTHKIASQIPDKSPVTLLGLSFGGVIAQEMARIRPVKKILLISSVISPSELPFHFQTARLLPFYRLSRGKWRIRMLPYWSPLFGIRDSGEQKLLQEIFSSFSDTYRMWAIHRLVNWRGSVHDVPIARLHGGKDKVFPPGKISGGEILKHGNHFMIYQNADLITDWIVREMEPNGKSGLTV
ncbi:MAG: alpha/beta hydrolase family protein [Bacteroidia bacterium]